MPRPAHPTRREDILAAARDEFTSKGFSGARMQDIAARAGISKAAVYLQFTSKEEVFRALVSNLIAENLPKMAPPDFGDVAASVLLRNFITGAFQISASRDIAFVPRLIVGEGQKFPELARFYYDEAISRLLGTLRRILRHGVERGEFACEPSDNTGRAIAGGIVLAALWRIVLEPVGAEPIDVVTAAKSHADTLLFGLLARKEV